MTLNILRYLTHNSVTNLKTIPLIVPIFPVLCEYVKNVNCKNALMMIKITRGRKFKEVPKELKNNMTEI